MKISHTWINDDGVEMAWATPSQREIAAAKRQAVDDVLEYCEAPRGWAFSDDDDDTSDDGSLGRYVVRITEKLEETGKGIEMMYALINQMAATTDTPGRVISMHRTEAAAIAAGIKLQRQVRRGNGARAYLPCTVLPIAGGAGRGFCPTWDQVIEENEQ